jgi:uncharacterized protein YdcH (DUF465 family)
MEKIRVEVAGAGAGGGTAEPEVARLLARRGEIEKRLSELERHLSLSPDEQVERSQLKKEKLRAKDRLAQLSSSASSSAARSDAG